MFEITEQARAEVEKRRQKKERVHVGGTPAHAAAEAHVEADRKATRTPMAESAKDRHDVRHPTSGQFMPGTKHPYLTDGHAADSPGNAPATPRSEPAPSFPVPVITPSPDVVVHQLTGSDHPERWVHDGNVPVQRLSFADPPVPLSPSPQQLPFHTAPISPTGSAR
ncbi:MAG TPA: hypothetical protein VGS97_25070 [Actinocrinis sp.]|uniref:hypothetical protein n=1 Tax=Actinocrinis sp. TaxID=1920516 RepID=UPI002DDCE846|nr:hypothetical protein [Actinocrinis sp.]HEV2347391.1 hypothetical protein [Actinocrinis sp.]